MASSPTGPPPRLIVSQINPLHAGRSSPTYAGSHRSTPTQRNRRQSWFTKRRKASSGSIDGGVWLDSPTSGGASSPLPAQKPKRRLCCVNVINSAFPGADEANEDDPTHGASSFTFNSFLFWYVLLTSTALLFTLFVPRHSRNYMFVLFVPWVVLLGIAGIRAWLYSKPDDPAYDGWWVNCMFSYEANCAALRSHHAREVATFNAAAERDSPKVRLLLAAGDKPVEAQSLSDHVSDALRAFMVGHVAPPGLLSSYFVLYIWNLTLVYIALFGYHTDSQSLWSVECDAVKPNPEDPCFAIKQLVTSSVVLQWLITLFLLFCACFETPDGVITQVTDRASLLCDTSVGVSFALILMHAMFRDRHSEMFETKDERAHRLRGPDKRTCFGLCSKRRTDTVVQRAASVGKQGVDKGIEMTQQVVQEYVEEHGAMAVASSAASAGKSLVQNPGAAIEDVTEAGLDALQSLDSDAVESGLLKLLEGVAKLRGPGRALLAFVGAALPFYSSNVRSMPVKHHLVSLATAGSIFWILLLGIYALSQLTAWYAVSYEVVAFVRSDAMTKLLLVDGFENGGSEALRSKDKRYKQLSACLKELPPKYYLRKVVSTFMGRVAAETLNPVHPYAWWQVRNFLIGEIVRHRHSYASFVIGGLCVICVIGSGGYVTMLFLYPASIFDSASRLTGAILLFLGSFFLLSALNKATNVYQAQLRHRDVLERYQLKARYLVDGGDTADAASSVDAVRVRAQHYVEMSELMVSTITDYDPFPRVASIPLKPDLLRYVSGYYALLIAAVIAKLTVPGLE